MTKRKRLKVVKAELQALLFLKNGGSENASMWYGICTHTYLSELTGEKYFPTWVHFSGDKKFPVPHNKESCPETAYTFYDLWDKRTKYGRLRWHLVDHLITELTKELIELEKRKRKYD